MIAKYKVRTTSIKQACLQQSIEKLLNEYLSDPRSYEHYSMLE